MLGIRRAAAAGQATKADRGVGLSGRLGGRNVECRVPRPVPKVPPPPVSAVPRPARSIHRPAIGAGKGAVTKDAARQSAGAGRLEPGSADETDAQHRKRHPKFVALCGRCTYDKNRVSLEKSYGSYDTPGAPAGHRTVWAAPRPARMGGRWGVGCVVCARLCGANLDLFAEDRRSGRAKRKAAKRGPQYANTKWSRFEIVEPDQIAVRGFRQHQETAQHRRAIRALHAPPEAAESVVLSPDDEELFRGAVPQPSDWLEAWSASRNVVSFLQAEKQSTVTSFLVGPRSKTKGRRVFAAMIRVMSMVMRLKKKVQLRRASAISVGLDDRGPYRLITFRCDTPCPEGSDAQQAWSGWASGCLGVLRRGGTAKTKTLEDCDDDYSKSMADSVVRAFERVATGIDGVVDENSVRWMLNSVRIGVADGAAPAQKCLRFLACGPMRNMLVIGRDLAHALRIATRDSLLAVKEFEEWWADVFDAQHALIPAIQNSEEWTEKLQLCQKAVLGCRGEQGAGLKVVAKCLQFAKQRFDSVATPLRQFCCLLVAIAMLLAHTTSDHRVKAPVRERARRRLHELPKHVLTAGMCASYAEEAIRFVRLFDKGHHDPARSWSQLSEFSERMRLLFIEGHIWGVSTDLVVGPGSSNEKTLLEIALQEAKNAPTIYYDNGRVLRLFQRPSKEEQQALQTSVCKVTSTMLDRVDVELSLENGLMLFTALDLHRWRQAFLSGSRGDSCKLDILRRHLRRCMSLWRVDSDAAAAQMEGVVAKLVQDNRTDIDANKIDDYRTVWVAALRPQFGPSIGGRVQELIRIYMAALDGTCGVERDLGHLSKVLLAHLGPLDQDGQSLSHCVEVLLDGPTRADEVAKQPGVEESRRSPGSLLLLPTELSRDCVRLWSETHGRRFLVYQPSLALRRKSGARSGTMAAVLRGVKRATDNVVKQAQQANGCDRTVLGVARAELIRGGRGVKESKKMKDFTSLTSKKRQRLTELGATRSITRASHQNPYTVGVFNPTRRLRRGTVLTATPKPDLLAPSIEPRNGIIVVANCCAGDLPATPGYEILTLGRTSSDADALQQLMRAQVIVWDATWQLDGTPQAQHLISAIVAIGLGKAALARPRWRGPRPHTSSALVHYLPAASQVVAKIMLVGELVCKHGAARGRKWRIVSDAAGDAKKLDTLLAVRDFLRSSRRVYTRRTGMITDW